MKKQSGFSILEMFVSLVVGVFLLAGVFAVFESMRSTSKQTTSYGEMQENGRFALTLLTDDLLRQGFWGGLSGNLTFSLLNKVPAQIASDCKGEGLNNSSFPSNIGHFRAISGITANNNNMLNCINNAKVGSDILQIKRVVSSPTADASLENNRYYLRTNMSSGVIFSGSGSIPVMDFGRNWEYQHHIYYIRDFPQGNRTVPALMLGRLRSTPTPPILFDPVVDGIEMIRFMFGVDTDNDGIVNVFLSSNDMTNQYWDNENNVRILAVKIFVLARDIFPDFNYVNNNTYQLGDLNVNFMTNGVGDNYRRLLFSSTVTLYNAGIDSW